MKKLPVISAALVFACMFGCQKPSPLTVEPPGGTTPGSLEVTVLSNPDTNIAVNSVDSSGVLPADQTQYSGLFLVNTVKYDNGHGVLNVAYASAYFGDRSRPLIVNGKTLGYWGVDLMPISAYPMKIGGIAMTRVPYKIHIGTRDTTFGSMYLAVFAGLQPNLPLAWDDEDPDPTFSSSQFRDTTQPPADLRVLAPAGGSVLSRTKQVDLRWTGGGPIRIVISTYNTLTGKTRPVLQLMPDVNTGSAVIEPSVLALLPRVRYYVFTFIIANRSDRLLGQQQQDRTLVQAASVYNSYVQIQ
ncbi:MAG TPA: hypothetical protein VL221_12355 [Bacteroidota bacterium]|nr:hypothetical protein [Bacteroidota bacterium]